MITNKKFISVFIVCLVLYFLPEIFINDAMLYLSGGIIGGTIKEILKNTVGINNYFVDFLIWISITLLLILTFVYLKLKWFKYFILIIIFFMLYVIDNLFALIPLFNVYDINKAVVLSYIIMIVEIIIKSFVLAWAYFKSVVFQS